MKVARFRHRMEPQQASTEAKKARELLVKTPFFLNFV